ncbi:MAG: aldolase/citrate lyase family protein [Bacteroidales bacterium]|nr:aldolase/citrate lyase family protein [Bacteroidales bacterium]
MFNTTLKSKLKNNELTIGSWITIGHPSVIEVLANAGFDWLTIDMEHTSVGYSTAQVLISTIQSKGMAALVRVSKNEEVVIKRVMDAGADGVIVPMINNAEDAKKAVEYVKYPPVGKRGVGLFRAQKYGLNDGFEDYKKWLSDYAVIIAQIEHIDAVNNIEEIISTSGIDGVIIGPYDLSGSMGIPGKFDDPKVKTALSRFEKVCKEKNFTMGFHVIEPDSNLLNEKINSGYNFLAFSTDFLFMGRKARTEIDKSKK